ncbi:hypothetical protein SAMN05428954_1543 [Streptomyces sp. 2112.3]|uniref:hypothetical protein n=1 Tax=Streptomyces sp. 2112.3 TaxID=1881023 RepID=UPI00089ACC7C|nr:hypothetical protein [Streptomyces sp. 2112.3]SED99877.1 hypothetical protein SAMN05428954_1543 [Streptomyces sp. 2112.3]
MNSSISEIVVAVMGIGGTLSSALLTQRSANRLRLRELEDASRQRIEDREHATRESRIEARRVCYASLNAAALDYLTVLSNFSYALEAGNVTDEIRSEIDQARRDHRARHADAQMTLSNAVMAAADKMSKTAGQVYGVLKRLDSGNAYPEESIEAARASIREFWDHLWVMRREMREDVGIGAPD